VSEPAPTLDPVAFEESIDKALAVLAVSKRDGTPWVTATGVSRILQEKHGVALHWRTIEAKLKSSPELATRRKRSRHWEFSVLKKGEERLIQAGPSVTLVDPANALQSVSTLHAMLGSLSGDVRVCDPYLDHVSVEHLHACSAKARVQFLTHSTRDEARIRRLLAAATAEGRRIEIRAMSTASIHDRYLIDDTSMVILGTSLNGFGRKQCFVVRVGDDLRSLMALDFDRRWAGATPWP